MRYLALFFFLCGACFAHTPQFVKDFREEVKQYSYRHPQPSLSVLRERHYGNCVSFANLGAWWAIKHGFTAKLVVLTSEDEELAHMVCVVWEPKDSYHKKRLWMFDNEDAYVADENDIPGSLSLGDDWLWEIPWTISYTHDVHTLEQLE